jgi:hypothetical protein
MTEMPSGISQVGQQATPSSISVRPAKGEPAPTARTKTAFNLAIDRMLSSVLMPSPEQDHRKTERNKLYRYKSSL